MIERKKWKKKRDPRIKEWWKRDKVKRKCKERARNWFAGNAGMGIFQGKKWQRDRRRGKGGGEGRRDWQRNRGRWRANEWSCWVLHQPMLTEGNVMRISSITQRGSSPLVSSDGFSNNTAAWQVWHPGPHHAPDKHEAAHPEGCGFIFGEMFCFCSDH